MTEQQLRDGMRAAVTMEPPLGFDPDDVVTHAKRTAYRRRTTFAAAAAVIAVAGGAATAAGLLAGGRDPAPVTPGSKPPAVTYQDASQELGESIVTVLPDVIPGARDFEVKVAAEERRKVGGYVFFETEAGRSGLGFLVPGDVRCNNCSFSLPAEDPAMWGRSTLRDGVNLTLGTSTGIDLLDGQLGPMFTQEHGCNCDIEMKRLTDDQLRQLINDERLVLPDPATLNVTPPPTSEEAHSGGR